MHPEAVMPTHRPIVIGWPRLPALLSEGVTPLGFVWVLFPGLPFSSGFWPETPCGFRPLLLSQRPSPCGLECGLRDQALGRIV